MGGTCTKKGRFKASYHLFFPRILVDRPVKAWLDSPQGDIPEVVGRHLAVRDHVVCYLSEESEDGHCLASLQRDLWHCSDCEAVVLDSAEDDDQVDPREED